MAQPIISVENLSKKYRISHQGRGRSQYSTMREAISARSRGLISRLTPGRQNGYALDSAPTQEDFWALKDVSFEVQQGEVLGIIGRNGAGKSTLLKILSRITEPTEGRVTLRGRVASLLEVGTGFHPELTGRENVYLNGAILGMSRAEIKRKFDEIVDFAGVEKFLDTPVKRYSSGMYVRLAFAVAAHLEPEVLIVDEVLAVGDAEFQKKCMGKMEEVSEGGRTVLFVSHNMGAVRRLCSKGLVLALGTIASAGSVDGALTTYGELFSKQTTHFKDELGRTLITINDVRLFVDGVESQAVASGETLEIRFYLDFDESITAPISVGFALENMNSIYTVINYSSFQAVSFRPTRSIITASIPDTPFSAGLYKLHIRILAGTDEVYWNRNLAEVRIDAGDFYGTGIRGEEGLCPWLQRIKWSQIEESYAN